MMVKFNLNLLATMILVVGAFAFTACSSSDSKDDDNVLTAEKLAGVWYANYADDQTEGDQHWTRVVEDYKFNTDGTGYLEYFQIDGNKLVDALFVRNNDKLRYTISGNTVTIAPEGMDFTFDLYYADGKLFTDNGGSPSPIVQYSKATAAQESEVDQLYAEWKGADSGTDGESIVNLSQSRLSYFPSEITIKDGQSVTGTLYGNREVKIAAGATVTLLNAQIPYYTSSNRESFGLECLGDATIILEGENFVVGGAMSINAYFGAFSGIYVPENATLTIKGSGKLTASCAFSSYLILLIREQEDHYRIPMAPGIGGEGNIVIESGHVIASGGENFPGIGSQFMGGDITIKGGTVVAYGGDNAPGIGSGCGSGGDYYSCGKITIANTVTNVTAYGGRDALYAIGHGNQYSTCGTVTIGGTVYYDGTNFQNGGESYLTGRPFAYTGNR
jgi:hypothetical protein